MDTQSWASPHFHPDLPTFFFIFIFSTEQIFPYPKKHPSMAEDTLPPPTPSHWILPLQMRAGHQVLPLGCSLINQSTRVCKRTLAPELPAGSRAGQIAQAKQRQPGRNNPDKLTAVKLWTTVVTFCPEISISSVFHLCLFVYKQVYLACT